LTRTILSRFGASYRLFPLTPKWVREWCCHHSLPVVAIGSIPYIYRRVSFPLRATPMRGQTGPHTPNLDRVNPALGSPFTVLCHGVAVAVAQDQQKLSKLNRPSCPNCWQRIRRL
jgi:hypothetical protein